MRKRRINKTASAIIFIIGLLLLNGLSTRYFVRLDLTADKRYSLSPLTKDFVSKLERPAEIELYLNGDLPFEFEKLRMAVIEFTDQLNRYSSEPIRIIHKNPYNTVESFEETARGLSERGLSPVNFRSQDSEGRYEQKYLFPGAIIKSGTESIPVNFYQSKIGGVTVQNVNISIQNLEYEIVNALRRLQKTTKPRIAFLQGQNEFSRYETADLANALKKEYDVSYINLELTPSASISEFSTIVVAGPKSEFSERTKFLLDQYLMHGGNLVFCIDKIDAEMDSLSRYSEIFGNIRSVNLDDLFFTYGVRINPNLVLDAQSALIPVNVSPEGQEPQFQPSPWFYSPLVSPNSQHPIGKNINMVRFDFVSGMDTVGTNNAINKTVLLSSSSQSREVEAPMSINLEMVNYPPDRFAFNQSAIPLVVLLEGNFTSAFKNRMLNFPETTYSSNRLEESRQASVLVAGDASFIRNRYDIYEGNNFTIEPMGYDRYTRQTFGNKQFILNAIQYMNDDAGWMQLRRKDFNLRMLNNVKLQESGFMWQMVNLILPITLAFLLWIAYSLRRKYRYKK